MRAAIFRAVLLATLSLASLAARAQSQSFTPQQRDEIVAIVRQALKQDPTILRDAVIALQAEDAREQNQAQAAMLREIAPELTHKPGDPVGGNPNGKVTLVEFSDVRCPYCRRMLSTLADLQKANPDLRIVYKDMPVLGPGSVIGAKAELAAMNQGAYEKLHLALMTGTSQIDEAVVKAAALKLGLNWARLSADMNSPAVQDRIDANLTLAHHLELQGTPAYIVGDTLMPGAVELADLQKAVDAARTGG
jgi:protein-disulfide isomerase